MKCSTRCTFSQTTWTKKGLSVLTAVLLLSVFLLLTTVAADGQTSTVNRYNIVLVTDASGSMEDTDPEEQRYEAIGKFIAQSTERGNYIGSVVFSDTVHDEGTYQLAEANGIQLKKAVVDKIRAVVPGGYTNIGMALQTAVEMLAPGDRNGLPSIVLLLSDGNTEMPDEAQLKISKEQRDDAVETARKSNIKVFSICLNANGRADGDELFRISEATGGEFEEVKKAGDLEAVFEMYRQIIFNSVNAGSKTNQFDATGNMQDVFSVPPIGVEEVNLSMPGITNANSGIYGFTIEEPGPDGTVYGRDDLSSQTYEGKRFITVKFVDPKPGEWKYTIEGKPGDRITVDYVYNTNLSATLRVSPEKDEYVAGDTVVVTAQLLADGAPAKEASSLGYAAAGTVTIGRNAPSPITFTPGANGEFTSSYTIEKSGSFTFEAEINDKDGIATQAGSVTINAGNSPPKPNADIEKTIYLLPGRANNNATIDLRPGASDEQNAPLEYEVASSSFAPDEYEMKGASLEMRSKPNAFKIGAYSRSKGSFEITAYDAEGASCVFNVRISTVDVTLTTVILFIVAAAIAALAVGFFTWWLSQKRFNGTCCVQLQDYNKGFQPEKKLKKPRGSIKLSAFKVFLPGLDAGSCKFQASGKKGHAFIKSKKPILMNGNLLKQMKLDGNFSERVQIAAPANPKDQETSSAHIDVWFVSDFRSQDGGGWG